MTKHFPYACLDTVEYLRCAGCGLVVSKTHYELDAERYRALNDAYFSAVYSSGENANDPKWRARLDAQARLLNAVFGVVGSGSVLDFGSGDGYLADQLAPACRTLKTFDPVTHADAAAPSFDPGEAGPLYLIATSVLEHLFGLSMFDFMSDLARRDDFHFCFHTLVCESVPDDPSWFYLTPLHATFFTNRAMDIALGRAGFSGCAYAPAAQMWICTPRGAHEFETELGGLVASHGLVFRERFVDYWKTSPLKRLHS